MYLKGQCHEISCFRFCSWIIFLQAPEEQSSLIGAKYANPEQSTLITSKVRQSWAKFADSGLSKPTQHKLGWLGAIHSNLFEEWRFRAKNINAEQNRLIRSKVCQSWAKYADFEQSTEILSKVGWLRAKYGNPVSSKTDSEQSTSTLNKVGW